MLPTHPGQYFELAVTSDNERLKKSQEMYPNVKPVPLRGAVYSSSTKSAGISPSQHVPCIACQQVWYALL